MHSQGSESFDSFNIVSYEFKQYRIPISFMHSQGDIQLWSKEEYGEETTIYNTPCGVNFKTFFETKKIEHFHSFHTFGNVTCVDSPFFCHVLHVYILSDFSYIYLAYFEGTIISTLQCVPVRTYG